MPELVPSWFRVMPWSKVICSSTDEDDNECGLFKLVRVEYSVADCMLDNQQANTLTLFIRGEGNGITHECVAQIREQDRREICRLAFNQSNPVWKKNSITTYKQPYKTNQPITETFLIMESGSFPDLSRVEIECIFRHAIDFIITECEHKVTIFLEVL